MQIPSLFVALTSDPTYYESFWSRPWIMVLLSICMLLIAIIATCLLALCLLNEAATHTEAKLKTPTRLLLLERMTATRS